MIAIDPGPEKSAWVMIIQDQLTQAEICTNEEMLKTLRMYRGHILAVEMIASYGMPVGSEVFETCVWIGRFIEACQGKHEKVYRKDVKMHLCGNMKAKDSNIRQALIDKYGPGKEKAIGLKATPGPLYGFKADMWAALGVGVTWCETRGGVVCGGGQTNVTGK